MLTLLLPLCLAVSCFPGIAYAIDSATPAQLSLAFNPAAVGTAPAAAQQLTASFSVTGSDSLTAELHYGIDYTAGAVSCTSSGGVQTCTVPVTFTPTLPGARKDTLFLMDGTTTLATVYLGGVGQSALALVQPGVVTQLVSGVAYLEGYSAVDEKGTVYVLSPNSPPGSNVYSVTKAGVVSVVPVTVNSPDGIAIDGAGILYISQDFIPGSTLITWNTVAQTQGSVNVALPPPYPCSGNEYLTGVAVDALGDLYTLDLNCQSVIHFRPNGTYVVNVIAPAMNANPFWITVDSNGNVFFSCVDIINEQLASGAQSAITNPGDPDSSGLAVDAADSLYVIPHAGGGVAELPASNYQTSQASLDPMATPLGIGLGSDGTLYVGNSTTLDKVDRSQSAIAFGQQTVGTASAAQNVGLYNGGNEPLNISNIAFTGPSSGFDLQSASSNTCSSGLVLEPGAYCQAAVTLNPPHVGNLTGSIVFTTSSLNNPNSTETVMLSGFVPGSYATLSPSPVAFANQDVNTTSAATAVTLSNTGTIALTDIVVSLAGTNPSDFAIATGANACGSSLAVGSGCSIYITFTPQTSAGYAATLSVTNNATNSPQTAALTGAGVLPPTILEINEVIHTTDTPVLGSSVALNIAEIIHTTDASMSGSLSATLNIAEVIHTTDTDTVMALVTPTQIVLNSSANPSVAGQTVTFTATVSSTSSAAGTPAGTVQFSINGTAAGAPVPMNAAGQALYSTGALADGASSITAVYSGDSNFGASIAGALSQSVLDFDFTASSSQSATIFPGQSATFEFSIAPQGAFGDTITFSASGLPPGATASFSPPSLTPGSTANNVVLTIQTAQSSTAAHSSWPLRANSPLLLGILLPLLGIRRLRRTLKRRALFLTTVLSLGIAIALSGCGSDGFFNQPPQTYYITVTATSGSLQRSTTVNLTVQ